MTSTGAVTENNGSGSVANTHTYTSAGVYEITLTVIDNNKGQGANIYQYVTVYDPSTGWATGQKEFTSPAGAVVGDLSASGKADFGFSAKYVNGTLVPIGNKWASLTFVAGNTNFEFNATAYDSLVVSGSKAILRGTGTLNSQWFPGF
jgi:PKD repeat protein